MMKVKKQKVKKICHKRKLKFQDYKSCLETSQIENKKKQFRRKIRLM